MAQWPACATRIGSMRPSMAKGIGRTTLPRSMPGRPLIIACALIASALPGCGEEKTFTADEFVDRVNEEGVKLKLGEPLITDDSSKDLYAVELAQVSRLPGSEAGAVSGSLSEYDEPSGAEDELESCGASADLLCYRLANIVVVLEGGGIEAQQLGVAVERLGED